MRNSKLISKKKEKKTEGEDRPAEEDCTQMISEQMVVSVCDAKQSPKASVCLSLSTKSCGEMVSMPGECDTF